MAIRKCQPSVPSRTRGNLSGGAMKFSNEISWKFCTIYLIFPEEFRKLTTNCTQPQTPSKMKAKSAWKLADFYTPEIWKLQSHIPSITETRKKKNASRTFIKVFYIYRLQISQKLNEIPLNWQGISFSCFQWFRWVSETIALKI